MTPHLRTASLLVTLSLLVAPGARGEEPPPAARAADVLREAGQSPDEGVRLLALERAGSVKVPSLEAAAIKATRSTDRIELSLALEALARIDVARNRDTFVAALRSEYRSVRLRGLRALLTLDDAGLTPRYVEVLAKDPDPDLRALAARGLGSPASPEGRAALRGAVAKDHPIVQNAAVKALVASGDLEIGHELLERARATSGPERRRLFGLVGLVPDPTLVPVLARLLEEPDAEVRVLAAAAIVTIESRGR